MPGLPGCAYINNNCRANNKAGGTTLDSPKLPVPLPRPATFYCLHSRGREWRQPPSSFSMADKRSTDTMPPLAIAARSILRLFDFNREMGGGGECRAMQSNIIQFACNREKFSTSSIRITNNEITIVAIREGSKERVIYIKELSSFFFRRW